MGGDVKLNHRVAQAWGEFHQRRKTLLNRNVSVRLLLQLLDATLSPTMLYGMAVLTLMISQMQRLDAV